MPARGERIVADRLAGSSPAWLYLHGLTSTRIGDKSDALFDFARTRGEAAWRFDMRGHGASSGTLTDTTLGELVDDTRCVLREAGPSILFGSSLGGLVGAWTAALAPESIVGLVLLAPALQFLERLRARIGATGRLILPHGGGELEFSQRVLDDFASHDEDVMARAIDVPTLVVHGELDDTVPVEASERFVAALAARRKELWVIGGGDHRLNAPIGAILERAAHFHRR